ncbi:hypothetical protein ACFO0A_14080 [Novosphingobium tardum]|uniref:Uncharacterized protein n=1 Tax=Novosphingobium tardum TaxID=1538021 RepID=A0ABV8RSA4_9SPHN
MAWMIPKTGPDAESDSGSPAGSPGDHGSGVDLSHRDSKGRFLAGNIGGGRRKGNRNRLTETLLATIEADFAEHGPNVLAKLREDDPASYLRIVASLVPRDLVLKREQEPDFSDMSDGEIAQMYGRAHRNAVIRKGLEDLS